jgi:hypothetical protein
MPSAARRFVAAGADARARRHRRLRSRHVAGELGQSAHRVAIQQDLARRGDGRHPIVRTRRDGGARLLWRAKGADAGRLFSSSGPRRRLCLRDQLDRRGSLLGTGRARREPARRSLLTDRRPRRWCLRAQERRLGGVLGRPRNVVTPTGGALRRRGVGWHSRLRPSPERNVRLLGNGFRQPGDGCDSRRGERLSDLRPRPPRAGCMSGRPAPGHNLSGAVARLYAGLSWRMRSARRRRPEMRASRSVRFLGRSLAAERSWGVRVDDEPRLRVLAPDHLYVQRDSLARQMARAPADLGGGAVIAGPTDASPTPPRRT